MKHLATKDGFMEIYLVGGAVRDKLLNLPVKERDWVVVGATPAQMKALGYRQVGKDFPVFLHPETQEEYALARTERKSGQGYTGFTCYASPEVTLEQDLLRRDLRINAMAQDRNGRLIDPYQGRRDLDNRLLRHVSPAFTEDPLRILRVARFAARYHHLGFRVADETLALMQQMVAQGEVQQLVAERVWQEFVRALGEASPAEFIRQLQHTGALAVLLPEVERLFGVPQNARYHPEIDTGEHTLLALQQAASMGAPVSTRYAVLLHDLGKGLTPRDLWPSHIAHEKRGAALVDTVSKRLRAPKHYQALAKLVTLYHTHCHRALEMRPGKVLQLLEQVDALRRPQRFEEFLLACEADARGRLGLEQQPYPQADYLRQALRQVRQVDAGALLEQGLAGPALGERLRQQRIQQIQSLATG